VVGPVDFLEFFGEADDGQIVQAEPLQLAAGGGELAFAAVHDDEKIKGQVIYRTQRKDKGTGHLSNARKSLMKSSRSFNETPDRYWHGAQ
jgi:hypothetical protein